jgi:hypothetical protein
LFFSVVYCFIIIILRIYYLGICWCISALLACNGNWEISNYGRKYI